MRVPMSLIWLAQSKKERSYLQRSEIGEHKIVCLHFIFLYLIAFSFSLMMMMYNHSRLKAVLLS